MLAYTTLQKLRTSLYNNTVELYVACIVENYDISFGYIGKYI